LEDLDKTNVLELNITFILSNHGYVKNILKDYQKTLEDLGNVDVLEPNNAFRVKTHYVVDNFRESWDYM
jgi:hypothetical protein